MPIHEEIVSKHLPKLIKESTEKHGPMIRELVREKKPRTVGQLFSLMEKRKIPIPHSFQEKESINLPRNLVKLFREEISGHEERASQVINDFKNAKHVLGPKALHELFLEKWAEAKIPLTDNVSRRLSQNFVVALHDEEHKKRIREWLLTKVPEEVKNNKIEYRLEHLEKEAEEEQKRLNYDQPEQERWEAGQYEQERLEAEQQKQLEEIKLALIRKKIEQKSERKNKQAKAAEGSRLAGIYHNATPLNEVTQVVEPVESVTDTDFMDADAKSRAEASKRRRQRKEEALRESEPVTFDDLVRVLETKTIARKRVPTPTLVKHANSLADLVIDGELDEEQENKAIDLLKEHGITFTTDEEEPVEEKPVIEEKPIEKEPVINEETEKERLAKQKFERALTQARKKDQINLEKKTNELLSDIKKIAGEENVNKVQELIGEQTPHMKVWAYEMTLDKMKEGMSPEEATSAALKTVSENIELPMKEFKYQDMLIKKELIKAHPTVSNEAKTLFGKHINEYNNSLMDEKWSIIHKKVNYLEETREHYTKLMHSLDAQDRVYQIAAKKYPQVTNDRYVNKRFGEEVMNMRKRGKFFKLKSLTDEEVEEILDEMMVNISH